MNQKQLAREIRHLVDTHYEKCQGVDDELASIRLAPDKWSLKEIMGHLVDSASNNHQRFVRLQYTETLAFPRYGLDNETWLDVQHYNALPFQEILDLWRHFNRLLCHIMEHVAPEALSHVWLMDDKEVSLDFLMKDYLRHLNDHMTHFKKRKKELRLSGQNPCLIKYM